MTYADQSACVKSEHLMLDRDEQISEPDFARFSVLQRRSFVCKCWCANVNSVGSPIRLPRTFVVQATLL